MCRYIDRYQSNALCCIHSCQMRPLRKSKANCGPPPKELYGRIVTSYSSTSYCRGSWRSSGPASASAVRARAGPFPTPKVVFVFLRYTTSRHIFFPPLSLPFLVLIPYLIPLNDWDTNRYTRQGIYLFCLNGRNAIYQSIYMRIYIKAYLYILML